MASPNAWPLGGRGPFRQGGNPGIGGPVYGPKSGGASAASVAPQKGYTNSSETGIPSEVTADPTIPWTFPVENTPDSWTPKMPVFVLSDKKKEFSSHLRTMRGLQQLNHYLRTANARRLFCKGKRPSSDLLQQTWRFAGILHEEPKPFEGTAKGGRQDFQAVVTVGGFQPRVPNIWLGSPGSQVAKEACNAHLVCRLFSLGSDDDDFGLGGDEKDDDVEMTGGFGSNFFVEDKAPDYYWQYVTVVTKKGEQVPNEAYSQLESNGDLPAWTGHTEHVGLLRRTYGQGKDAKAEDGELARNIVLHSQPDLVSKASVAQLPYIELHVRNS